MVTVLYFLHEFEQELTHMITRSKIKWVFPNLLFSVVHMDISRSLFCVHCRSYILNNN